LVPQGEHEQYTLTIGMMLGIRVAVGRPQQLDDLTLMDFMQVDKYLFPPKGAWGVSCSVFGCNAIHTLLGFLGVQNTACSAGVLSSAACVGRGCCTGNSKPPHRTPPHHLSHDFKFKDYAPKVFHRIRQLFGVDSASYMLSVSGNCNYLEFMSNSKSGQFFFYSHDGE
jgi:1-phosphatidylinositol-4-phosphate 5-kinase